MKTLQRICVILVLTLTLALSTNAGHIPCGVTDDPPPPASQATTQGDITTGITGEMSTGVTVTDSATDVMLSLLQSLLSLF